jgi:hypothetical protein
MATHLVANTLDNRRSCRHDHMQMVSMSRKLRAKNSNSPLTRKIGIFTPVPQNVSGA